VASLTCALGPDSAGTLLTKFLRGASSRIDAACYEVGPAYRWAMIDAARRGVAVRLLLDRHGGDGNAGTAVEVARAGGRCAVLRRGRAQAHWKLLIVDSALAVGTGNLIWRDAPRDPHGRIPPRAPALRGTREWWVFISGAPSIVSVARTRLREAWGVAASPPVRWGAADADAPGEVGIPRPEVAPLDLSIQTCRLRLLTGGAAVAAGLHDLISAARRRVLITAPYIDTRAARARSLIHDLTAAHRRGATVRVLLGTPPAPRDRSALRHLGIATRVMDVSRSTRGHAKGAIVDGVAVVSSANWSGDGLGGNWEAALVIDHPGAASYFADAWARDDEVSDPL